MVAGSFMTTPAYVRHAFLYRDGQYTELLLPGDTMSYTTAMAPDGTVVGVSSRTGAARGFVFANGQLTDLGDFLPMAVNQSGVMAGYTAGRNERVALRVDGQLQYLAAAGGARPYAINEAGMMGGGGNFSLACLLWPDRRIDLMPIIGQPSPDKESMASALNNYGVAVGVSPQAFVWMGGDLIDLEAATDLSGTTFTGLDNPRGINDRGQILCEGYSPNSLGAPCLLEPIHAELPTQQLVNTSSRCYVGTGERVGVLGFVVSVDSPCNVLVRAVGPGLAKLGVSEPLADPVLSIHRGREQIMANDDWGTKDTTPILAEATRQAGAFALADSSKDSALLLTLPPGNYTAHVSGANGSSGIALVEVYVLR